MISTHPADVAAAWAKNFSQPPLSDTLYSKQLQRPLADLAQLHNVPMPWKVRLSVLVHGVIPKSYLAKEKPDDSRSGNGTAL